MKYRLLSWFLMLAVIALPLALAVMLTGQAILAFVFFYPLLMSGLWMIGGLSFYLHYERHWKWGETSAERDVPDLAGLPLVSIIVPCFNEARNGEATILAALGQHYANIEVIAVNDGSSDTTGALLERLAAQHPRLRVLHLAQNQGKAMALRMGALAARSDYLVCIDGDAMLDPDAVPFLVRPLLDHPRVLMAAIMLLVIVVGTAMDMTPTILILTPVLMPIVKAAGIDPVYFGVLFIMNNAIGLITPPVGVVLNTVAGVGKISMDQVTKGVWPFMIAQFILMFLMVLFPAIVTVPARWFGG